MKRSFCLIFGLILSQHIHAQQTLRDTINRHEIGVNLLPLLVLSSEGSINPSLAFTAYYRKFFGKRYAYRVGVALAPFMNAASNSGVLNYNRSVGQKVVFGQTNNESTPKMILSFGGEKILRYRRLIHSVGAELLISYRNYKYDNRYIWYNATSDPSKFFTGHDSLDHNVDSLGNSGKFQETGIGVRVLYSLRYQLTKRFYIAASLGPSLVLLAANGEVFERNTQNSKRVRYFYPDITTVPFFGELSVCYRFR
jgi:hypothetical protein